MAKVHGKGTVVKLDDLSGALATISSAIVSSKFSPKVDRPNTTCFGARGARRELIGLVDNDVVPINGFYQRVAGTKVHGKGAAVLFDGINMAPFFKGVTVRNMVALDPTTCFGALSVERDLAGLQDADADCNGFYDPAVNGSWATIKAALAAASVIFSLAPEGWAIGNLVEMGKGTFEDMDVSFDVDKPTPITAKASADDAWDLGVCLHGLTNESAAANYTGVDETAATTNGGTGHLHCTSFTSGSCTVKIQHSTDDITYVDLIAFTALSAVGAQRVELAAGTTVNRYVRAQSAGTFNLTFVVTFARLGYAYGAAGTYRHFRGLIARSATSSLQIGPSGSATGAERINAEVRLRQIELSCNNEEVVKFGGELLVTGAVTHDVF